MYSNYIHEKVALQYYASLLATEVATGLRLHFHIGVSHFPPGMMS